MAATSLPAFINSRTRVSVSFLGVGRLFCGGRCPCGGPYDGSH